jgi:hypothetical protein
MLRVIFITGGVIAALVVWMIVRVARLSVAIANALHAKIDPVLAPLAEGRTPAPDQILALAADPATRGALYRTLRALKRADLFPPEYGTTEHMAESDLVVWLMHGNELGAAPDDIELVSSHQRPPDASTEGQYFVFKFRTNPPHWAAASGWLAGVAGPYLDGEEAFDAPAAGVFSKFESFESRSPEEHLSAIVRGIAVN